MSGRYRKRPIRERALREYWVRYRAYETEDDRARRVRVEMRRDGLLGVLFVRLTQDNGPDGPCRVAEMAMTQTAIETVRINAVDEALRTLRSQLAAMEVPE